jgi:long-subunit acyl-CoA synthetase (AMP-forming)
MFKAKNKDKELEKYFMLFDEHAGDESEYSYYNTLYKRIKVDYQNGIRNKKIDIGVERARLKAKAGQHIGISGNMTVNLVVMAITILANGIILAYSVSDYTNKFLIVILTALAAFTVIMYNAYKHFYKDNKKDQLFSICLSVLEEIEEEIKEEKALKKEQAEKVEQQAKVVQNVHEKSIMNKVVLPAAMEVAASIVKGEGLLGKLFRKSRRK